MRIITVGVEEGGRESIDEVKEGRKERRESERKKM